MTIQATIHKKYKQQVDEYQLTPTLQEIQLYRQWKPRTYSAYEGTLLKYCKSQQKTLPELLREAEADEETTPKTSKRRIRKRLLEYILQLQQEQKTQNTIKIHISRISDIYRFHDIEIPSLPRIKNDTTTNYEDLPTHEELRRAIKASNVKTRALITALVSSGLRRGDLCKLTVGDYVDACKDFVGEARSIHEYSKKILNHNDLIIPMFHITSEKTGVKHYTFMSDEATRYIAEYLMESFGTTPLSLDDRLFGLQGEGVTIRLRRLNKKLGLGNGGRYARLHPHGLRKFFATQLTNNGCDFLSVEFMMGHKLDQVRDAYYKADPERLRLKYRQYMEHLTFLEEISYRDVTTSELEELEELRRFRRDTDTKLSRLEDMMNRLSFDLDMEVK